MLAKMNSSKSELIDVDVHVDLQENRWPEWEHLSG